jgi:coproporphyrinogen III oxidase-like Fe-S oxidoreductase
LDKDELENLLGFIFDNFKDRFDKKDFEYTIECNPESVDKEKLEIFKKY